MEYKLYEIYSHKFAVYVVAKSKDQIEEIQPYNKEMDMVNEVKQEDYIIFHDDKTNDVKRYLKTKDYLKDNQHLHKVGHCFIEWTEFQSGTVEIVSEHVVENGQSIVFWEIIDDENLY